MLSAYIISPVTVAHFCHPATVQHRFFGQIEQNRDWDGKDCGDKLSVSVSLRLAALLPFRHGGIGFPGR
jgi:hypothetical protein